MTSHGYKLVSSEKQPSALEEAIIQSGEPDEEFDGDDDTDHGVPARTIQAAYTFTKATSEVADAPELKVQCIVASKAPMEVILSFPSSE